MTMKSTLELPFLDKKGKECKLVFETEDKKLLIKKGKALLGTADLTTAMRDLNDFVRKA